MPKTHISLSVDTELYKIAKSFDYNLSEEFENWLRCRMQVNNNNENKEVIDYDVEIAKQRQELERLQNEKERKSQYQEKEKETVMIIDNIIDNEVEIGEKWNIPLEERLNNRINGAIYLFKKKYNKLISFSDMRVMLIKRAKERELIA